MTKVPSGIHTGTTLQGAYANRRGEVFPVQLFRAGVAVALTGFIFASARYSQDGVFVSDPETLATTPLGLLVLLVAAGFVLRAIILLGVAIRELVAFSKAPKYRIQFGEDALVFHGFPNRSTPLAREDIVAVRHVPRTRSSRAATWLVAIEGGQLRYEELPAFMSASPEQAAQLIAEWANIKRAVPGEIKARCGDLRIVATIGPRYMALEMPWLTLLLAVVLVYATLTMSRLGLDAKLYGALAAAAFALSMAVLVWRYVTTYRRLSRSALTIDFGGPSARVGYYVGRKRNEISVEELLTVQLKRRLTWSLILGYQERHLLALDAKSTPPVEIPAGTLRPPAPVLASVIDCLRPPQTS